MKTMGELVKERDTLLSELDVAWSQVERIRSKVIAVEREIAVIRQRRIEEMMSAYLGRKIVIRED